MSEVSETNPIDGATYHTARQSAGTIERVDWSTPGLRVTRLRLLSDPGFPVWDVSYCHGELNGKPVDVSLPFDQLHKYGRGSLQKQIVEEAIRYGVHAKRLGILDSISTLN